MKDSVGMGDAMQVALGLAGELMRDSAGLVGYGVATVCNAAGEVVQEVPFANLITTKGDEYYVKKACVSVGDYGSTAPSPANGMKLGTSQTAAAKSGAGSFIGAYLSGSNNAFEASHPTATAVAGTDTGWQVTYECFWGDGDVTSATIWEVALVNDQATNAAGDATTTYARVKFPTVIDKSGAGYTLRVTWQHKFLGGV